MPAAPASLIVLGLGGVSTSFLQIHAKSATLQPKFLISALANSRFSLQAPQAIPVAGVSQWLSAHPDKRPLDVLALLGAVQQDAAGPVIVVDNSSSPDLAALYPAILRSGASVCTPNKKSTSSSLKLYEDILAAAEGDKAGLYYGESTVGAGLPILSTLKELVATGDEILKVEGVLSGTLSYIFNNYSPAVPAADAPTFSSVIHIAKELGYTEPDPRDDLSGVDVARKLTILSRLVPSLASSLPDGYASIPTQSLVPPALEDAKTMEDYMTRLAEGDAFFADLRAAAEQEGKVLRYVGVIDPKTQTVKCSLEKYDASHPFATSLSGSDNIISFTTARYPERPLIIQGAGAGGDVTAMGVWGDCLRVWERRA